MKKGIDLIADERRRQIEVEKWTPEHDDEHAENELALAAAVYAIPDSIRNMIADKIALSFEFGISVFHLVNDEIADFVKE